MRECRIIDISELEKGAKESFLLKNTTEEIFEKERQELINPFAKYHENYSLLGNQVIGAEYL
ncbi:hypothetical protein KAJ87_03020 [Candidatus Pacearchaeota archaeon]|nr:hypothetical protein [Candidatus Pacearchaeota archaeon]